MPDPHPTVDDVDVEILELLGQNARRTFADIGTRVGLSAPAVKRRVDRLEREGVITGYTTVVDHARIATFIEAFTELRFVGSAPVDVISGIADAIPEIQAVFTISGDPDALAWIRVRDVTDLTRVVNLLRSSGYVVWTKTLIILGKKVRSLHEIPLLLDGATPPHH